MRSVDRPASILYVGVRSRSYPRNSRLRRAFEDAGYGVTVLDAEKGLGGPRNLLKNALRILRARGDWDVVVLSEFSLKYALISAYVARRAGAVHIVDGFVGLFESEIEDRNVASPSSFKGRYLRFIDRTAVLLSDYFLIDTEVRAQAIRSIAPRHEVRSLPVGAPEWARSDILAPSSSNVLRVLYYGNYIPLHGVEYVITAVERVGANVPILLTLVGVEALGRRALARVPDDVRSRFKLMPPVPETELKTIIDDHDLVLGIFGTSPKAASVIANKVWQGLARGRPVLTRSSEALSEIADIVGKQLLQVRPADPEGIARAFASWHGAPTGEADVGLRLEEYTQSQFRAFELELRTRIGEKRRKSLVSGKP